MDAQFWHRRWQANEIGFHLAEANPLLLKHFDALGLSKGNRIFLPLCGKTLDIGWLIGKGFHVVGAELNAQAVEQLFKALRLEPVISSTGSLKKYSAEHIDIYQGDLFDLSKAELGLVDAVYDRAALIALPGSMREAYVKHLMMLTDKARQLVITMNYDQRLLEGPPFSVSAEELAEHYAGYYRLEQLGDYPIEGGLKGKCPANEQVWLLTARVSE